MQIPRFPVIRAGLQSRFADGWSKPHPDCGVCDKQQFTAQLKHMIKSLPLGFDAGGQGFFVAYFTSQVTISPVFSFFTI